jgi:hypothetical protein
LPIAGLAARGAGRLGTRICSHARECHIRTLHFDTRRAVHYSLLSAPARLAGSA